MSDGDTSSANPEALEAFVRTAMQLDARLTLGAVSLRAAIAEFTASCREYPTGIDESLADQLQDLARRNVEMNVWVRQVADQFAQADAGQLAVLPSATLQSAASTLADLTAAGSGTPEPLSVGDWSAEQRVEYAIQRALAHLPEELRRQLEALLTPATLAWMVAILGAWVIGQAFGYGEIADAAVALVAIAMLGPEAFRAGQELGEFVMGVAGSQTPDDLDAAGAHLATVVSIVGVDGLMAILAHEASGALGSPADGPAPSGGGALEPAYARVGVGGGDLEPGALDQSAVADPLRMSNGSGAGGSSGTAQLREPLPSDTAAGGRLPPSNTPEGKAARWVEYQQDTNGAGWDYERWSRVYDLNQNRALAANAARDAYLETLGWGKPEVTVDAGGVPRRLDIADVSTTRGIEYKTGYQTATVENLYEVSRDAILVEQSWSITWVFKGTASAQLLKALADANISVEFQ